MPDRARGTRVMQLAVGDLDSSRVWVFGGLRRTVAPGDDTTCPALWTHLASPDGPGRAPIRFQGKKNVILGVGIVHHPWALVNL